MPPKNTDHDYYLVEGKPGEPPEVTEEQKRKFEEERARERAQLDVLAERQEATRGRLAREAHRKELLERLHHEAEVIHARGERGHHPGGEVKDYIAEEERERVTHRVGKGGTGGEEGGG